MKDDLTSLAWSALKFTELKLHCPILSCYEQTPIKVGGGIPGRPRRALVRYCVSFTLTVIPTCQL